MEEYLDVTLPDESGANLQLADPALVTYYQNVSERVLWLDSVVDENSLELTKKILIWNAEDERAGIPVSERQVIRLYIMSGGGLVYPMATLMDSILLSKTPVYTYNMGLAASAACVILVAGHKRFAMQHSHAMWHAGAAVLEGNMEQIQSASKHLDRMEDQMRDFLIGRSNIDLKLYKKYKDKDWYMDANEQLSLGIVDEIIAPGGSAFCWS